MDRPTTRKRSDVPRELVGTWYDEDSDVKYQISGDGSFQSAIGFGPAISEACASAVQARGSFAVTSEEITFTQTMATFHHLDCSGDIIQSEPADTALQSCLWQTDDDPGVGAVLSMSCTTLLSGEEYIDDYLLVQQ